MLRNSSAGSSGISGMCRIDVFTKYRECKLLVQGKRSLFEKSSAKTFHREHEVSPVAGEFGLYDGVGDFLEYTVEFG